MTTIGLDIGGANLKAATADGRAVSVAFPLWKSPEQLPAALSSLIGPLGTYDQLAVTMTGELADCFATKAEGVARILHAVEQFAAGRPIRVWTTAGRFTHSQNAAREWPLVAAANWHALATWAGRFASQGHALLLDIGSTTTDIIPLRDGVPCPRGRTDVDRLMHHELVYTGVRRTPVCAVKQTVTLRGRPCPLAAELFATMLDVYLITGKTPADPTDTDTADGRPATVPHAENRLAHMLCCDRTEVTTEELRLIADEIAMQQFHQIQTAVVQVIERNWNWGRPATVILSGSGTFLARDVVCDITQADDAQRVELAKELSPEVAEAACAYAVACLAAAQF